MTRRWWFRSLKVCWDERKKSFLIHIIFIQKGTGSPLLLAATLNSEVLEVGLSLWKKQSSGLERQYLTMQLTNAKISDLKSSFDNQGLPKHDISFQFERSEWIATEGGISAVDSWVQPVVNSDSPPPLPKASPPRKRT